MFIDKLSDRVRLLGASLKNLNPTVLFNKVNEIINELNKNKSGLIGYIKADLDSIYNQYITLSGGTSFVITDVVVTNISDAVTNVTDLNIWTEGGQQGIFICNTNDGKLETLSYLTNAYKYLNFISFTLYYNYEPSRVGNNLVLSVMTPNGTPLTCDVYVYGYVIQ